LPFDCARAPEGPRVPQGELIMLRYLILAQSEVTANALGAWLELLGERKLGDDHPSRIVWDRDANWEGSIAAYETLVHRVEQAARGGGDRIPLNQVVALVDSIRPADLSAVEESGNWDNLIAMLILAFPEIVWVFGVMQVQHDQICWNRTIVTHHNLASLFHRAWRNPLFDPTGLREWVRAYTNGALTRAGDDLWLPERQKISAAIDEERPYAYLHGYLAYRFGCRADVVITWALMKKQFGTAGESHGYWLLLEDMSLNFPDRESRTHLLHLSERANQDRCPQLDSTTATVEKSEYRILVTGQTRPHDDALAQNRAYLRDNKASGKGKVVLKPASGMFDLWEKIGLFRKQPAGQRHGDLGGDGNIGAFDNHHHGNSHPSD